MANSDGLSFNSDALVLAGEINFTNVVALRDKGDRWLRTQAPQQCRLDLGKVTRCNSAATTLLLSWLRTAQAVDKTVVIENIPSALRSLMDLGGLEDLLPTSSS